MKKIIISSLKAPKPIGPYNQAVMVNDTLYISGQIPLKAGSNEVNLSVYNNLPHVWQIFGFLPEAKQAIREISEFLNV